MGEFLKHKIAKDYLLLDQRSYNLGWTNGRLHGFFEATGIALIVVLLWRFIPWA